MFVFTCKLFPSFSSVVFVNNGKQSILQTRQQTTEQTQTEALVILQAESQAKIWRLQLHFKQGCHHDIMQSTSC